jgi:hypothetical protein
MLEQQVSAAKNSSHETDRLHAQIRAWSSLARQAPEPIFSNVRAALMFSFRLSESTILAFSQCYAGAPTFGARVMLTSQEWHQQSAAIRRIIETNFRGIELALVLADYAAGRHRIEGARICAEHLASHSSRPFLIKLGTLRYFGVSEKSAREISRIASVPQRTVERYLARVREDLGRLSDSIAPRLESLLVDTRICCRL